MGKKSLLQNGKKEMEIQLNTLILLCIYYCTDIIHGSIVKIAQLFH